MIALTVINNEREAEPIIPPRVDAVERAESETHPKIAKRNQVVRKVNEIGRKR